MNNTRGKECEWGNGEREGTEDGKKCRQWHLSLLSGPGIQTNSDMHWVRVTSFGHSNSQKVGYLGVRFLSEHPSRSLSERGGGYFCQTLIKGLLKPTDH